MSLLLPKFSSFGAANNLGLKIKSPLKAFKIASNLAIKKDKINMVRQRWVTIGYKAAPLLLSTGKELVGSEVNSHMYYIFNAFY